MNKNKTGIFIDLDGTLLNDQYQISEFDLKILKSLPKKYHIYLITGKAIHHALKFYHQLNLKTFLITSAGQVISKANEIIWQKSLKPKNLWKLITNQEVKNIVKDFVIQTNQTIYVSNLGSPLIPLFYEKNVEVKLIDYKNMLDNPVGLYLNLKYNKTINRWKILNNLTKKWGRWFEFHPWEILEKIFIVHVVPAKINKWSAVVKVAKWDKINFIITFGNGRNDIPILKNADMSFAMKNATNEVKFYSQQVTEFDNNNSGVGKACEQFLKI